MSTENGRSPKTGKFRPPTSRDSCHRDIKTKQLFASGANAFLPFPPCRHTPFLPILSFASATSFLKQLQHTVILSSELHAQIPYAWPRRPNFGVLCPCYIDLPTLTFKSSLARITARRRPSARVIQCRRLDRYHDIQFWVACPPDSPHSSILENDTGPFLLLRGIAAGQT
ncbi:hypothetical protein B0H13DRAFT_1851404 [Mycena leptocephala]|nr:hypothetical protein B0H13DRAFT_1851404 [Mycena leptocephala]